jgi:2-polyprenyl-6-methoxyphenol hydroxylase-like FAD-dependent oxidoreductase
MDDVARCAKDVAVWQIRDMKPLPGWVKGRAIIIGDAAHPSRLLAFTLLHTLTFPAHHSVATHQAGGAMTAIEDAEALGAFLRGVDRAGVHAALRRVFRVRFRRASAVQAASRRDSLVGKPVPDEEAGNGFQMWDYVSAEQWEREQPDMVLTEAEEDKLKDERFRA